MIQNDSVLYGDSFEIIKQLPDSSIDMIFTSPPYAERRKKIYGGVAPELYVEWFLSLAAQLKRVMTPAASFFLNIKPHCENGERSLYVFDLVSALVRTTGFKFIEEYAWTKNAFPGQHAGRFKNAFEPVYHFAISAPDKITFNPSACATPTKQISIDRALRMRTGETKNGSGMGAKNLGGQDEMSLPSNVVHVHNISNQFTEKQDHPATFPEGLVEFFVKSFSNTGDLILDPFGGSGTTGIVCKKNSRKFIIIEKLEKFYNLSAKRIAETQYTLFD